MQTRETPTHCPQCNSKKIELCMKEYKKDEDGEDTDYVISGTWFCMECGNFIGVYFKGYNDIDAKSL